MSRISRRGVLVGGAALGGLSLGGLSAAGCGEAPPPNGDKGGPEQGPRTPGPGQGGQGVVASVTDVPVGGGRVYDARRLVVTQPTAGDFKGFSAVCTHQGCLVSTVQNGTIGCPCHNSKFSIVDGSVRQGPATKPLEPRSITVDAGQIRLLD
jgi:Rieske Fe-S protein